VVLTEWPEFAAIDASLVAAAMSGDVVFDTRNVLDINEWTSAGLRLVMVGRGSPDPVKNSANANAA
jgi:UDPglucose 6-dehydrogenase